MTCVYPTSSSWSLVGFSLSLRLSSTAVVNSADFVAGAMIGRLVCVCVCECRELIVVVVEWKFR